jgi:PPM family protein phosphatase
VESDLKDLRGPVKCPQCGAASPSGYNFCKVDGTPLRENQKVPTAEASLSKCKCGNVIAVPEESGFCTVCGSAWKPRDHVEYQINSNFAAITDCGIEHELNEDDVSIASETYKGSLFKVLVVCDGLSSAQHAKESSSIGAKAASDYLISTIKDGWTEPRLAMSQAIAMAHQAVCTLPFRKNSPKDPPGTTIVAAVLGPTTATIGWVGDSRAYLVQKNKVKLLTHDHSWINQVIDAGLLTEEEATKSVNAHVIMHCIGPIETSLTGNLPVSGVVSEDITKQSVIILCSDGLWNYAESIEAFEATLATAPKSGNAMTLAKHLVFFALAKGGHDNISVAVASNGAWK